MKKPDKPKIEVIRAPDKEPIPVEILEQAIVDIAAGMRRINASRLKREALVLLLHDASKVGRTQVRAVIECLDQIELRFLKPKRVA